MIDDLTEDRVLVAPGSPPDETIEVSGLEDPEAPIEQAELQLMRRAIVNASRVVDRLKQEVQQLRGQVQRNHTQMKMLETRIGRR